jgi:glycosyltransferase involved in cell wall biosynthesis
MSSASRPKVSVLVLTYDHEKYIDQALHGALRQKTRFDFEVVVAEDCSRDATAEKVRAVARAHPGRVRVLDRPRNLGLVGNFLDAYSACAGEYVAILEGDDIWHDPRKLQRLADVLDRRRHCSFAFHNVRLLFEDGREQDGCCPSFLKPRLGLRDFVANNYVPNCSAVMFRHRLIERFPDWFGRLSYYDWPLHILHLEHGPAAYLSEPLSTYRIHGASAWHGASHGYRLNKLLEIFAAINEHLEFRYEAVLRLVADHWRVRTENEALRQRLEELGRQHEAALPLAGEGSRLRAENEALRRQLEELERQHAGVCGSRAFRVARTLSGVKRWSARLVRKPSA